MSTTVDQDLLYHAIWLEEHLPDVELHLLEGEGHLSAVSRLPEIIATMVK